MKTGTNPSGNTSVTFLNAMIVFVIFMFVGALPGVLYGGYLGLMVAHGLFGAPNETSVVARLLIGGGMVLGFGASFALFWGIAAAIRATITAVFKEVAKPREIEAELQGSEAQVPKE